MVAMATARSHYADYTPKPTAGELKFAIQNKIVSINKGQIDTLAHFQIKLANEA